MTSASNIYFDIIARGGLTLNPFTHTPPYYGYVVALPQHTKVIKIGEEKDPLDVVMKFMRLAREQNAYFGAWHKRESDEIVFDLVEVYSELGESIELGILRNQEAIHDIERKRDIFLPTGQSGTFTQQITYARMKAQEIITKIK